MNIFLGSQAFIVRSGHPPAADNDNFPNAKKVGRSRDEARDAQHFGQLWDARQFDFATRSFGSLVKLSSLRTNTLQTYSPTAHASPLDLLPSRIRTNFTKPVPTPFRRFLSNKPTTSSRTSRTPSEWRDASDWLRHVYFHHALTDHLFTSESYANTFTVWLSKEVAEKACQKSSAATWLLDRIGRCLQEALGRPVEFWFVIEQAATGMHLHGEFELERHELEKARAALRKAAGAWDSARQHQTHTAGCPTLGWVSYSQKDAVWSCSRSPAAADRDFSGEFFAATRSLRQKAQALYNQDRRLVMGKPQRLLPDLAKSVRR